MRLAIVTCRKFPQLTPDDFLFAGLLPGHGISPVPAIWDDPTVKWQDFDAVLIRSPWDYYLKVGKFLKWLDVLEASGKPVWNRASTVRWNISKDYFVRLERLGIPLVPTIFIDQEADLKAQLEQCEWEELIVKPTISASAFHTYRLKRPEIADHLPELQRARRNGKLMVQPFLQSVQTRGEISLVYLGGNFSHSVIKKPAIGDFRVQADHGGETRAFESSSELRELSESILHKVGEPLLYARVDLVFEGDRPVLGELELAEPSLYLGFDSAAPARFASVIAQWLKTAK